MDDPSSGRTAIAEDTEIFEAHRGELLALAYRMLGDLQHAEDIVQDTWLRWIKRDASVENVGAYLARAVTRLCLNEAQSARVRREAERPNALPEPVDLSLSPFQRVARLEDLSMAVLVALRRLTPAERAALLLHDVFGLAHAEIAELVGKTEAACRQLIRRARGEIRQGRRFLEVSDEEHRRLLYAFADAATRGDLEGLASLLAEDVVMVADAGVDGGTFGGVPNLPKPLEGRSLVSAFVARVTPLGAVGLETHERDLNGRPSLLLTRHARAYAVLSIAVSEDRIGRIYIQNDSAKLSRLGP